MTMSRMSVFVALSALWLVAGVSARSFRASLVFDDGERVIPDDEQQLWESEETAAYHARRLVHDNTWATMATTSTAFDGVPYGNIVSYSDGVGEADAASTGELFFYLTPMDFTAADLAQHPNASVSISFAQEGQHACKMDVEDPTCWRLTLLGSVAPVPAARVALAEKVLFSRHPQMKHWPSNHGFRPYVLELSHLVLLDFYGGAKHVPVDKYYHVKL